MMKTESNNGPLEINDAILPWLTSDIAQALTPGMMVEVTADIAEELGAFQEDALSLSDAEEASLSVESNDE